MGLFDDIGDVLNTVGKAVDTAQEMRAQLDGVLSPEAKKELAKEAELETKQTEPKSIKEQVRNRNNLALKELQKMGVSAVEYQGMLESILRAGTPANQQLALNSYSVAKYMAEDTVDLFWQELAALHKQDETKLLAATEIKRLRAARAATLEYFAISKKVA